MRLFRDIFDDWLTRSAGIVFLLIVTITLVSVFSNIADTHPLLGVLLYSMVPMLFIVGGVIFILAILRS